jgi:hypothetical protein
MKTTAFVLIIVVLLSFHAASAQQPPSYWLIGHWDGIIDGFPANQNPARTLRVHAVAPDGTAQARWAITGQSTTGANVKVDGSQVNFVVAGSKSVVELTREGDDSLAGKITFANGKPFPIKLTKIKLSTAFDGEWTGGASVLRGCGSATYNFSVKDSLITGNLRILYYDTSPPSYDSIITGEVAADGKAVIEIAGPARTSQFTGTFSGVEFRASDPPIGNRGCAYDIQMKRR